MGIKGLFKIIGESSRIIKLDQYAGKVVAIDAILAIFQWHSVGQSRAIVNGKGKHINHLQGLFFRTIYLIGAGITPIYIFDGPAPAAKQPTLDKRRAVANRMKITGEVFTECKNLLTLMGVPWYVAPSEAEAQAAALTRQGLAAAVLTSDSDALVFGARRMLMDLDLLKGTAVEYDLDRVLGNLGLTFEAFVDFCICLGTDYTGKLPGLGPKKILEEIKKYGSVSKMPAATEAAEDGRFNYTLAAETFSGHRVTVFNEPPRLAKFDGEAVRNFLVVLHGLDPTKIDTALLKIK